MKNEESTTENDGTSTFTAQEPTPYQYGLCAEEVIQWLNETTEDASARMVSAARSVSPDAELQGRVCNMAVTIPCWTIVQAQPYLNDDDDMYFPNYRNDIPKTARCAPLTFRVWITCMYNFERDEDYYHVLLEEHMDARPIFYGNLLDLMPGSGYFDTWVREAGFTWSGMDLRARWPHTEYTLVDQWNLLPQANPNNQIRESITGWSVDAEVSVNQKGVSGKITGDYKSEEHLTTVENEVSVVNNTNVDGNWMQWLYTIGQQVSFTAGKFGKYQVHWPPEGAVSRGESYHRQSWDWVVAGTKRRGAEPFSFDVMLASMKHVRARIKNDNSIYNFLPKMYTRICECCMALPVWTSTAFSVSLPVPERFKHIYSFTTDEISDLSEYNNLMLALNTVSSRFNELYGKLIRKDESGNLLGRTAVSEEALKNRVGQEWYALAHEIEGKKITVSKPYKFYVKDENDKKLKMVKYNTENGRYESVGTYLVIDTNGIKITNE